MQQKEAEYYTQLAPRILQFVEETISKNPELSAEGRKKWAERYTFYKENPESLFSFKTGAIFEWKNRFELLFILAPYLNRSQIEFAFKKMGLSKKDREKNEEREDKIPFPTTEHECRSEILRALAQHENIFLRRDSDRSEAVLSPADEQAFSLWEMVRTRSGQEKGKHPLTPPSIEVMMQYMVQFIENQNLLPSFRFARIKTIRLDTSDGQNQRLKQELVFTHKQEWPLRIRHRTILAEYTPEDTEKAAYDTKINLGYLALRRLIALYLENPENSKTPENLPDQFLSDWLKKNTPKMTKPKANPEPLQVRLKSRLNSMKAKTGNIRNKGTKQDKIRFIAGNINHTYRAETGKPLSSAAYKKLESEVRYFSKVHLREYISENLRVTLDAPSLLDSLKTQLGSPKPKALKNVICKENLEDVCTEFADAHLKWIEAKYSQIDAATDAELNSLAEDIRLKAPKTRETRQIQPVGIPPKAIIVPKDSGKALYGIFKNKTGSLITFDIQPVNRAQPNNKAKIAQYWKDTTSWHFLLAMAVTHLGKGKYPINIDGDSPMQPLSSFPITCRIGDKNIQLSFTKRWRTLIKRAEKLGVYWPDARTIYLHRDAGTPNIQGALENMEKERLIFIQAILQWERSLPDDIITKLNSGTTKPYLDFKILSKEMNLEHGINKLRDAAFHINPPKQKFSEVSGNLGNYYQRILQKEKEQQQSYNNTRK